MRLMFNILTRGGILRTTLSNFEISRLNKEDVSKNPDPSFHLDLALSLLIGFIIFI